jgi:glycosyltransferase involved in cell wall biosynthesis
MKLSVVICTYGRYDIIDETIDSVLSDAIRLNSPFEVIIVDNNLPGTRKKIKVIKNKFVRVVEEDKTGLSNARNRGVMESSGDIILFNDDDIFAGENYLSNYYEFFKKYPKINVAGGKTVPHYEGRKPEWIDDELEKYLSIVDYGDKIRPLKSGEYLVGANIAFRRKVFDSYGLFNVSLGRQGASGLLSNEETEFVSKIPGYPYYLPDAVVEHRVFPERLTKQWFKKRVAWQAISDFSSNGNFIKESEIQYEINDLTSREFAEEFLDLDPSQVFRHELRKIYLNTYRLIVGY